jgi:hypothetical protein
MAQGLLADRLADRTGQRRRQATAHHEFVRQNDTLGNAGLAEKGCRGGDWESNRSRQNADDHALQDRSASASAAGGKARHVGQFGHQPGGHEGGLVPWKPREIKGW